MTVLPVSTLINAIKSEHVYPLAVITLAMQGDPTGHQAYRKMMALYRYGRPALEELQDLLTLYRTRGFSTEIYPIVIDSNKQVIDGWHRLAWAILINIEVVHCKIDDIMILEYDLENFFYECRMTFGEEKAIRSQAYRLKRTGTVKLN